jgi:hypothetical protein
MKKLQLAMMASTLMLGSNAVLFAQATLEPSMYSGLTLQVGQVHSGELLATHPQMSDGSHADCFQLDTEAGKEYSVTLRSTDFDSYLMLGIGSCADVMLSLENDDFEDETLDARIVFTAEYPQYSIFVNSYDAGFTGAFTLHID